MKKRNKIILIVSILMVAIIGTIGIYLGTYYPASDDALDIVQEEAREVQMNHCKTLLFTPEDEDYSTTFIFYPGGKVQMEAYAPLCAELADRGITCVLVQMPFHLAVFNQNAADDVIEYMSEQYQCESYYIGGHSLGGVMAAYYAYSHPENLKGIVFLAAYSSKDLSSSNLKALSIYGSKDGVLDMDSYNDALSNMPTNFLEAEIEGGCHSYFGDYGMQKGDGNPTISRKKQLSTTADIMEEWIQDNQE